MSRKCSINIKKGVLFGNRVSHSNRKTKHQFKPNMQNFTFKSDVLKCNIKMRMTVNGMRTVEHNGGIDAYFSSAPFSKLSKEGAILKRRILKLSTRNDNKNNDILTDLLSSI